MLIVNRNKTKIIGAPHGSEIRPLIDRTTSPINQCSLAEEILPPGASVTPHHHEVIEEIYYVIEGEGVMRIDDEEREVGAGDAVYIPRFSRHTLTNTGNGPMKILLICGPAFFYEDHRTK
jgi:mannose-6-phosphate isomerase-like protein (cupin superfamily)